MSVLYNQFCITDVLPDLKTKTIIVKTNFKIDAATVNLNTVSLYDYSAGDGQLTEYSLYVEGKNICITLNDFPPSGTKYYLKITNIYDALNREINYAYNDYIIFGDDVITGIDIVSPAYREVFSQNIVGVKLKITDALTEGSYKIQVASDNAFFKLITTISCNASKFEFDNLDESLVSILESKCNEKEIMFNAEVNYNGQLFIRARAERTESEVGRWSEFVPFTINTIPVDSMDTTFLDSSLTTFDLFEDDMDIVPLECNNQSVYSINDGAFVLEFNKEILLPEGLELNEDGYIDLGTVIGFRKELK